MPRVTRQKSQSKKNCPLSVWEHLRNLLKENYQNDAILLFEICNTAKKNNRVHVPSNIQDITTLTGIAKAYVENEKYACAEYIYRAIVNTLPIQRSNSTSFDENFHIKLEDEIRYSYYECLMKLKWHIDAYALMTNSYNSNRERQKIAIDNAIAKGKNGAAIERNSTTEWKSFEFTEDGLEGCPYPIGSAGYVMRHGNNTLKELHRLPDCLVLNILPPERYDVESWLIAQECIGLNDIRGAIVALENMSHKSSRILYEMAILYYKLGRKNETIKYLLNAFNKDPRWIDGMDLLSYLMYTDEEKYGSILQNVSTQLLKYWPDRPETYTVAGYVSKFVDSNVSLQFANKAMELSSAGTEQRVYASLLKCVSLLAYRTLPKAIECLKDSLQHDPANNDLNVALVDLLLENDDFREAKSVATALVYRNSNDIHAKLIKAHVLINVHNRGRDFTCLNELIRILKEIITLNRHTVGAVVNLTKEIYSSNPTDKCVVLLEELSKLKYIIPRNMMPVFYRLQADFNLKRHRPIQCYNYLVSAMALGFQASPAYISELEQEFRLNGQIDLDRQLRMDSPTYASSGSSTVVDLDSPVSSVCTYNLRSRSNSQARSSMYRSLSREIFDSNQPSTSTASAPIEWNSGSKERSSDAGDEEEVVVVDAGSADDGFDDEGDDENDANENDEDDSDEEDEEDDEVIGQMGPFPEE